MTNEEAIKKFEKQLHSAMVVLDSGFGTSPGECDRVCRERKEMAEIALSALRQQECVGDVNKALTLDELSERNAPVFLPIKDFPNGGYWCLCENGYIIPPSGHGFMAKERPNWVFYSQKPEEDDHDA